MYEKRKRHLTVIEGGKSKADKNKINAVVGLPNQDPKIIRLDQWRERMVLLFARQRI